MGVTKEVLTEGDGKTYPKTGDELTMHYTGTLTRTGVKFDSSVDKGKPFIFKVGIGMVIKGARYLARTATARTRASDSSACPLKQGYLRCCAGWDEGVVQMSLGEKAKLLVSSDYGYGEKGAGMVIPPNADLTFEVELMGINGTMAPGYGATTCMAKCSVQ